MILRNAGSRSWRTLLAAVTMAACSCAGDTRITDVHARQGVLDLSDHDFQHAPLVVLGGEWNFYANSLVIAPEQLRGLAVSSQKIPQTWPGAGFGVYSLKLRLPQTGDRFKVHMEAQLSAYDVYVAGVRRAASGKPGATAAETEPATKPLSFSLGVGPEYEILLRVANFHHRKGGIFKKILLGTESAIDREIQRKRFLDVLLVGVLLMTSVYYFIVFAFRPANRAELFFALTCLTIMGRTLTTGEKTLLLAWPGAPFAVYTMLEYLSYFWGIPFTLSFFSGLFPGIVPRLANRFFYLSSVLFSLAVFAAPLIIYSHTAYLYLPVMAAGVIFVLVVLVRALLRRETNARLLLAGFLILALAVINDALNTLEILRTSYLVHFGFLGVVVCYSAVLAGRFALALVRSERAESELRLANETLEQRVKERTQELEAARDVAEDANRQKDNFLAVVSHDLRSPLSGILSALQAMRIVPAAAGQNNTLLEASEKNAERLLRTVDTLLAARHTGRGDAATGNTEEIFPARIVAGIISDLQTEAAERKVRVLNELPTDWKIRANARIVRHVITNLLSNALKFTSAGRSVVIYCPEREEPAITVRDEGIGMDQAQIKALLAGQRATVRAGISGEKGSGLGLSICREMLMREGGRLEILSEPGQGSAVTVVLPAK